MTWIGGFDVNGVEWSGWDGMEREIRIRLEWTGWKRRGDVMSE